MGGRVGKGRFTSRQFRRGDLGVWRLESVTREKEGR